MSLGQTSSDDEGIVEILTKVAGVLSIAAAYLYFTGWTYLNEYYEGFGIQLGALDLANSLFPLEAFRVLYSWWGLLLVTATTTVLVVLGKATKGTHKKLLIWILLGLFPALFSLARLEAHKARRLAERTTLHVALSFKTSDIRCSSPKLMEANEKGELRLLTQTKDSVVVFYQPGTTGFGTDQVYVLQKSDLALIHITAR